MREFANEKFRICENLNIYKLDTAVKSLGLNGVCERNHPMFDRCTEKILEGQPETPLPVALPWAIMLFIVSACIWPKSKCFIYHD